MKKYVSILLAAAMLFSCMPANVSADTGSSTQLPAFPGAEGGGKYTSGGRGGDVYEVTTLADYGVGEAPIKGSLRDAVSDSNRTIVFRVGGTIRLKQSLKITGSNLTIAGQTAPGDGITVADYTTTIDADNIIMRYMRFRLGDRYPSEDDAFGVRYHKNIIIDHCSFSWSVDEVVSLYDNKDTTVQWSISQESMLMTTHQKGRHGYGGIWGGQNASYLHNLIAHSVSRNPRFATAVLMYPDYVEASNNIIYNWGFMSTYGGGDNFSYNLTNNYYKYGPSTYKNVRSLLFGELSSGSHMYLNGNIMDGNLAVTADNWKGVQKIEDRQASELSAPIRIADGYSPESAQAAYEHVLADAGANLPKRDAYDARVIQDVRNRTGQHINSPLEIGGYPDYETVQSTVVDADHDGMDDAWELARGLTPLSAEDRNGTELSAEGYTNLEVYLNDLIVQLKANGEYADNPAVTITAPANNTVVEAGSSVSVAADASDIDGIARVEWILNGNKVGESTSAPYSYTWNHATDGTHYLVAKAVDTKGLSTQSNNVAIHVNTPGPIVPWTASDVGDVGIPGHTQLINGDPSAVVIKSSGDVGQPMTAEDGKPVHDAFQYAYQSLTGNGEIVARVDRITATDDNAEAGVMIRDTLDPGSKMAMLSMAYVKFGKTAVMMTRNTANKAATRKESEDFLNFPYYVKLVRLGNEVTGLISADKSEWKVVSTANVPMGEKVYFGLFADASKANDEIHKYNTSAFSDVVVRELADDYPQMPQNLAGQSGDRQAELSWSAAETAVSYKIKRSEVPGGPYSLIKSDVTENGYIDAGLTPGKPYYYVITAVNDHGESFPSQEVKVEPAGELENVYYVHDDYEAVELETVPANYTVTPDPKTDKQKTVVASVPGTNTGNTSERALYLYDAAVGNVGFTRAFAPQTGAFILETDMMFPQESGTSVALQARQVVGEPFI
ncbi:Ig-like domain-containing protein [Paenibacillus puerhi]|uniref:Ig-like domain-containing protein n=1 Tax=Paenibacillus puerhi TaxID=2692622 RepID=UPI0013592154|nr:Ig-like domain-containing protein [Paenibacillus puerhi]